MVRSPGSGIRSATHVFIVLWVLTLSVYLFEFYSSVRIVPAFSLPNLMPQFLNASPSSSVNMASSSLPPSIQVPSVEGSPPAGITFGTSAGSGNSSFSLSVENLGQAISGVVNSLVSGLN